MSTCAFCGLGLDQFHAYFNLQLVIGNIHDIRKPIIHPRMTCRCFLVDYSNMWGRSSFKLCTIYFRKYFVILQFDRSSLVNTNSVLPTHMRKWARTSNAFAWPKQAEFNKRFLKQDFNLVTFCPHEPVRACGRKRMKIVQSKYARIGFPHASDPHPQSNPGRWKHRLTDMDHAEPNIIHTAMEAIGQWMWTWSQDVYKWSATVQGSS